VKIEFDPAKNAINIRKHGVALADFCGFDAEMIVKVDDRRDYGEVRFRGFGRIDGQGYCVVYTRRDDTARLISFRRVHDKEMRRHE
jgi:uncharacterized DUF497 family protein